MNKPRTPEEKAEQRQASRDKRRAEPRPLNGLGFFVARQTRVVYHPITAASDWDYDVRNQVCDPSRGRAPMGNVVEENARYLRWLGKQHRKEDRRRVTTATNETR